MKKFFGFFGNFFKKIFKFFKEIKVELKKVVWPSWKQTKNNTLIVIICVLLIGLVIWVLDFLFGIGAKSLLGR